MNGYLERLASDPNAYAPDVRKQIDWRIGITGQASPRLSGGGADRLRNRCRRFQARAQCRRIRTDGQIWDEPREAIEAATVNAAELLGLASEIGTIEPGKSADLIAVAGDPLADVRALKAVAFVMARGEVIAN